MEREEIIRKAREAGFSDHEAFEGFECLPHELERFAALVAEHWIETNKALAKEIIELKKQAEQEPVGHVLPDGTICWDRWCPDAGTLLYTHPVRTKDLTDDELADACGWKLGDPMYEWVVDIGRWAIAADREKNNEKATTTRSVQRL